MIIRFSVTNFRSIYEEQTLDFEATASNNKSDNLVEQGDLRLLKSVVIYGANASGKSNLLRAFNSLRAFIVNSIDLKKGDRISERFYDPFLLKKGSSEEPTKFKVEFIGYDERRYIYETHFDRVKVIYECLIVYETSQPSTLFLRENSNEFVKLYDKFVDKSVDVSVLSNNLFLSKVGNSPNEQIGNIYLYFKDIEIWNFANTSRVMDLYFRVRDIFENENNSIFARKLSKLINISDTKIESIFVEKIDIEVPKLEGMPEAEFESLRSKYVERFSSQTYGVHIVYDNEDMQTGTTNLEFVRRQSAGTISAFAIGGLFLHTLLKERPGLIILDEFDNSLHPDLCKFLIEIFHNPLVNSNGSQLAFVTHETQLLDRDLFRRDQIWLAEKNDLGRSEFFSVIDFKDGREGMSFDKWYNLGKFGGVPHIRKTEFFADYEQDATEIQRVKA